MFKSFDEFSKIFEFTEKFKVVPKTPKTPNGEAAYAIKYIGPNFDKAVLDTFLKTKPETKDIITKLQENPDQYFVAYATKKDGDKRAFSQNSVWSAFIELINASKSGSLAYAGFTEPPYNGFVPYEDLDKFLTPNAGSVVQATQAAVGSIASQTGGVDQTQPATTPGTTPTMDGTTQPPVANPTVLPTTEPLPNQPTPSQPVDVPQDVTAYVQTLNGLKPGSRGHEVQQLQKAIELIARAKGDQMALDINKFNIRANGQYDGIWQERTSQALGHVLGGEHMAQQIGQTEMDAISQLLAKYKISVQALNGVTPSEHEKLKGTTNPKTAEATTPPAATAPPATASAPPATTPPAATPPATAATNVAATPAGQVDLKKFTSTLVGPEDLGKIYIA